VGLDTNIEVCIAHVIVWILDLVHKTVKLGFLPVLLEDAILVVERLPVYL